MISWLARYDIIVFYRDGSSSNVKLGFYAKERINLSSFEDFMKSFQRIYEVTDIECDCKGLKLGENGVYIKGYFDLIMPKHVDYAEARIESESDINQRVMDSFNIYI